MIINNSATTWKNPPALPSGRQAAQGGPPKLYLSPLNHVPLNEGRDTRDKEGASI